MQQSHRIILSALTGKMTEMRYTPFYSSSQNKLLPDFSPLTCTRKGPKCHAWALFSCYGRGRICPVIPLSHLKTLINPVIYDHFFCEFPLSRDMFTFNFRGGGSMTFFLHCHCHSPGSLQCMAAREFIINQFIKEDIQLFSERALKTIPICCGTFSCCPIDFLGCFRTTYQHGYVFLCQVLDAFEKHWPDFMKVIKIILPHNLVLNIIICSCPKDFRECFLMTERRLNYVRLNYCCALLSRITFHSAWLSSEQARNGYLPREIVAVELDGD